MPLHLRRSIEASLVVLLLVLLAHAPFHGIGTSFDPALVSGQACEPAYPTLCLPVFTGVDNINCNSPILRGEANFPVLPPDPYNLDANDDGVGCEANPGTWTPAPPTSTFTPTSPPPTGTWTSTSVLPTATWTPTPSPTITATEPPTLNATPTKTSTATGTPTGTATPSITNTVTETATGTPPQSNTDTPSPTATNTVTVEETSSPTSTAQVTVTLSGDPPPTSSSTPEPSETPTPMPTLTNTPTPTLTPTPTQDLLATQVAAATEDAAATETALALSPILDPTPNETSGAPVSQLPNTGSGGFTGGFEVVIRGTIALSLAAILFGWAVCRQRLIFNDRKSPRRRQG